MAFLSLIARFNLDASGFNAGIKQAESATKGLSKDLNSNLKGAIAGAFGTAAIAAAGKATLDYAGQITDLSERLGVSTDALQEFDFAARLTGTNLEAFTGFLEKLGTARENALEGNDDLIASFARLGVNLDDLRTKRLEDLTRQIGRAVQGGDAQDLSPALRAVGGKSAGALIPTFKGGLEEAAQQARDAGAIISKEDTATLDEIGDRFSILARMFTGTLGPAIAFVTNGFQGIADAASMVFKFLTGFTVGVQEAVKGGRKSGEGPFDFFKRVMENGAQTGEREALGFLNQRTRQEAAAQGARNLRGQVDTAEAVARGEEKMQKLRDAVADKELKLLPAAEQRARIEERIAKLKADADKAVADFAENGGADKEKKMLEAQAAFLDAQARGQAPENPQAPGARGPSDPLVNNLERIGFGFGKNTESPQVSKLQSIDDKLRDLIAATKKVDGNTARTAEALA